MSCPTKDFKQGKPNGKCWSNGHYRCKSCVHLNPIFIDDKVLDMALSSQGNIQFYTLKNGI